MKSNKTFIEDLILISPNRYEDSRGYFMEVLNDKTYKSLPYESKFVQINESKSEKFVLRGLHFQLPPYEQSKLVRVPFGKIIDVAVDLRKNSKTFGMHQKFILSDDNNDQLFIPKGFAHGFVVLSEIAIVNYAVDSVYDKSSDCGIRWDDPVLNIDWEVSQELLKISEKDKGLKFLDDFQNSF